MGLVQKHQTALIFLTGLEGRSFSVSGSLISLRGQVQRRLQVSGLHEVDVRVLKDKRRGPGWTHAEVVHGPDGLC